MGLVNTLLGDQADMLCGGRHNVYREMIENMLTRMDEVADLVFFEDGPVVSGKFDTFVKRQNDKYKKSLKIIDKVYDHKPLQRIIDGSGDIPSSTTHLALMEAAARRFGKLIVTVTKECDAELVQYANRVQAMAVLADDSDFLVFSGNWRYWSLRKINMDTLETLEYNKLALRRYLNLSIEQMKVLATLGGNDILQYEDVRKFHDAYCVHQASEKFPFLADFIRKHLNMRYNSYEMIDVIANKVLRDDRKETLDKISESLMQYSTVSSSLKFI